MSENTRNHIRKLLKTFGIKTDETLVAHIAKNPGETPLRVRITLEDLTEYGENTPEERLSVVVEGTIDR